MQPELNVDELFDDLFGAAPESVQIGTEATDNEPAAWKQFMLNVTPKEGKPESMLIRFLPDITTTYPTMRQIASLERYRCILSNGDIVFYHSPRTLNNSRKTYCPTTDGFFKAKEKGDAALLAEYRRRFKWSPKDICKVQVIASPSKPELVGEIFNFMLPKHVKTNVENALKPSESDIEMGITAFNPFNLPSGRQYRLAASVKIIGNGEKAREWGTSAFADANVGVYVRTELATAAGLDITGMKQANGFVMLTENSGDAKLVQQVIVKHLQTEMSREGMFFGYEPASDELIATLKKETTDLIDGTTPIAKPAAPAEGTSTPPPPSIEATTTDNQASDAEADAILNSLLGS